MGMLIHNRQGEFLENAYDLASTEIGGMGTALLSAGIVVGCTGVGAPIGIALIGAGNGLSTVAWHLDAIKHICQKNSNAIVMDMFLLGVGRINNGLNNFIDTDFQKNMLSFYFQTPSLVVNYANN